MRTAEHEEEMAQPVARAREALKEAKRKAWEAAYPEEQAAKYAARGGQEKDKGEQQAAGNRGSRNG